MRKNFLELLVSILLGASWAVVLIGAFLSYRVFENYSILLSVLGFFIGSLPGFILVAFFEVVNIQIDKIKELKRQTLILEEIKNYLKNND